MTRSSSESTSAIPGDALAQLRSELATPEGFARRIVLDRDTPRLGILAIVLGVVGLLVTLSGVVEDLGARGSLAEALASHFLGRMPGGETSAGALIYAWLPILVLLTGVVLLAHSRLGRAALLRELHARYRARGHAAEQHSLGLGLVFWEEGNPSDLVALESGLIPAEQFASVLAGLRAGVAAPGAREVLQSQLAKPQFRAHGEFAATLWPQSPPGLVLATRRPGAAVVVIDADPLGPATDRSLFAVR